MKIQNLNWTKNTDVTEEKLKCVCGQETNITHCSNWHDGSGMFYCQCDCGKESDVRWHEKNKRDSNKRYRAGNFLRGFYEGDFSSLDEAWSVYEDEVH